MINTERKLHMQLTFRPDNSSWKERRRQIYAKAAYKAYRRGYKAQ